MGQHLGLEAAHLAGRCGLLLSGTLADDVTHHRIVTQPLGVVDILIPGQATVNRPAQQRRHAVADVVAGPEVKQVSGNQLRQSRRIIKIAIGEKTGVRTDPRSVELQLDGAVESEPQRVLACFTHEVLPLSESST